MKFQQNESMKMSDVSQRLSRRQVLQGLVIGGVALSAAQLATAQSVDDPLTQLVESSLNCVRDGELCLHHIMLMSSAGDNSLIDCAQKVTETIAICQALAKLAAHNSSHLKAVASASIVINRDCEAECRRHAENHVECRAMAEACKDCIDQCEALLA